MPKQSEVMALVFRLKDEYLSSDASHGGGGASVYYKSVRAWADAHQLEGQKHFLQSLHKCAQIAWHHKSKSQLPEAEEAEDLSEASDEPTQYTIGGLDLPRELVYYAPDGGKTKDEAYLHVYVNNGAPVGHLEMDAQIFNNNLERQKNKKKSKDKLLKVALERSGGNRAVLLKDILDDAAKAA